MENVANLQFKENAVAQEYAVKMENASAEHQDHLVQTILIVSVVVVARIESVVVKSVVQGHNVNLELAKVKQFHRSTAFNYRINI